MENRLGWFILFAWLAGVCFLMTGLASVHGQPINSNPQFKTSGPAAYTCRTPKQGNVVQCQQWIYPPKHGWKRTCVQPGQPVFGNRLDSTDRPIQIEHPASGCVAMFDELWADTRNWAASNMAREARRVLKPAWFRQYVEIKEAGTYKLEACMARDVLVAVETSQGGSARHKGGINVSLLQWQATGSMTKHLTLPVKKAMFGSNWSQVLDGAKNFDFIGQNEAEIEAASPLPHGSVVGNIEEQLAYVVGVGTFYGEQVFAALGYFIDGYDGHAGLLGTYSTSSDDSFYGSGMITHANWGCHNSSASLMPGFYVIHAEIFPTGSVSPGSISDYQSFGAIRNIELSKVE